MNTNTPGGDGTTRREFFRNGLRVAGLTGAGVAAGALGHRVAAGDTVWQIDPRKCLTCSRCATECVLEQSAVKCVNWFPICGYCDLCTGYFEPQPNGLNTGAENQLCPTSAILRKFIEDPYFEYLIDEDLCIGCAKCIEGCRLFGNGSFHLQVRHDRCVNCNECAIAKACPGDAFYRAPAADPYFHFTT
jgi:electron transport complex protein RnfB